MCGNFQSINPSTRWSVVSFCSFFPIQLWHCNQCLSWFALAESSPFTNRVGVPFSHWPRTCLFGLHAHLSSASLLNAPVGIQRWALPSTVPFSRLACPHQLCKWKFPWEIIP